MEVFYFYIARRKECGCIVAACVDNSKNTGDTAQQIGQWIIDGYIVERIDASEESPITLKRCEHRVQRERKAG